MEIRRGEWEGEWYLKFGIGSDTEKYRSNITWKKIFEIGFVMWQMRSLRTSTRKYEK